MRRAKLGLLVGVIAIAVGYLVASGVLPRLGLRIGFEAGMVLQGVSVFVGIVVAGAICGVAAFKGGRILQRSPGDRCFSAYAVTIANGVIALLGVVCLCYA